MYKRIIIWVLAIIITAAAAVWQRRTGPTYPMDASVALAQREYSFQLPRTHGGEEDCKVDLGIEDEAVSGKVFFRRYPTVERFTDAELVREEGRLVAVLPRQPPAGKLEYYLVLSDGRDQVKIGEGNPVVLRFKGGVPAVWLILHIAVIFAAMLISNVAGLMAAFRDKQYRLFAYIAFALLFVGGMILGPIVQQYAFGKLWTGVPFGWDLTDNKTLIAIVAYLVAVLGIRKADRPALVVIAALMVIIVFSIPHSVFGSQLDYITGAVSTG